MITKKIITFFNIYLSFFYIYIYKQKIIKNISYRFQSVTYACYMDNLNCFL